MMNDSDKQLLIETLRNGVAEVVFTKKDGTERLMQCTTAENWIPKDKQPKGSERSKPSESLAVFDVQIREWRSFRWDSVISFKTAGA
jgi:hypothetical protein